MGIVFHRKIPSFLRNFHADLCNSVLKNHTSFLSLFNKKIYGLEMGPQILTPLASETCQGYVPSCGLVYFCNQNFLLRVGGIYK
jgi:hypothetical protein